MWKNVIGYEDAFEISNKGELRNKKTNRILKQHTHTSGYQQTAVKLGGRKGINVCFKIHRLVAEAFIPNPSNLPEVNHLDGDKENNSVTNLEWSSHADNMKHAVNTGLIVAKPALNLRKLSNKEVNQIRLRAKAGCRVNGFRALALEYLVSKSVIADIVNLKTYML